MLTVTGQEHTQVCVQVPPVPLQKILEAPPDKLLRSSGLLVKCISEETGRRSGPLSLGLLSVTGLLCYQCFSSDSQLQDQR